jgi:DNA polymerase-3 subunit alpha
MSKHFTHLHLHTDYSLLDGAITLDKLIDFGKKQNFKALAITDHGNIFGAVKFFQKCKKAGIKPILGIEAYLAEDAQVKDANNKYYHQILLVQNKEGYHNLCKLIAYSFQQGFYFKPRIDYAMLEKHSAGLIVTSACLGGHIAKLIKSGDTQALHDRLDWFLRVFGPDRYFLEVQPEDQAEQVALNRALYALSAEKNIKLVAAGDCHYVQADDREAHEVMLAIQTQDKIDNPNRYTFGDCRVYIRTEQEMLDIFHEHPEAVWNSGLIADMCNFDFETDKLFFPRFEIPAEHTQDSFFKFLCQKGLEQLRDDELIPASAFEAYQARLNLEMDLILSMGFVGYFLVVSDFIQWAYRNGIPVGPGRGSAAGSLVAWSLQITNIDPLKYNLLFERFLNPERITMPDIDIDFCIEGRERVIEYIRDKYGHDKVCQIITFGTMLAKGVIKDVARSVGLPFEDSNAITNLIPDHAKTLTEALEQESRLKDLMEGNPKVQKIFDIAFKLEGLTRHASKHAAGIVISPDPIEEVLPVYVPAKSTELVAQYAMSELESIGFLKIDLLGLKNLTLIDHVVALVLQNYGIQININKLPLDDAKTFALICAGNTSGVFQLESDGLKEVLRKLQPDKFEDIIAVNALYRPGPLGSGMVEDYIERRHGRQSIKYLFPELESILQETYGVIVYQEQVMKIASTIAGYSLGESDILRRAMGKKKAEVMAEQSKLFVDRAQERSFDGAKAVELFDLMAYFAGYGFNKSHSAAYALIAYQTAYLKANYPAEFMACLISLEATNPDKMSFYLQEAKGMGISIISPNINRSQVCFSVVDGTILFGLQGIKNVGLAALENIIQERNKKGPFKDLFDFCKRIDLRTANKRVIENLICAGAFDVVPGNRAQQFEELAHIMDMAITHKKDSATGQMGLFGAVVAQETSHDQGYVFAPRTEWSDKEKLEKEQAVIGFYLSSHPLETYRQQLNWFNAMTFEKVLEQVKANKQESIVVVCGMVQSRKDIITKKGDRMSFVQLEDSGSTAEMVIFPKTFTRVEPWLDTYNVFVVKGAVDVESDRKCKIKVQDMVPIELVLQEWPHINSVLLTLPDWLLEDRIIGLKNSLAQGSIPLELIFRENGKKLQLTTKMKVGFDQDMLSAIEKDYDVTVQCIL